MGLRPYSDYSWCLLPGDIENVVDERRFWGYGAGSI
jgi:hypothetical protein